MYRVDCVYVSHIAIVAIYKQHPQSRYKPMSNINIKQIVMFALFFFFWVRITMHVLLSSGLVGFLITWSRILKCFFRSILIYSIYRIYWNQHENQWVYLTQGNNNTHEIYVVQPFMCYSIMCSSYKYMWYIHLSITTMGTNKLILIMNLHATHIQGEKDTNVRKLT